MTLQKILLISLFSFGILTSTASANKSCLLAMSWQEISDFSETSITQSKRLLDSSISHNAAEQVLKVALQDAQALAEMELTDFADRASRVIDPIRRFAGRTEFIDLSFRAFEVIEVYQQKLENIKKEMKDNSVEATNRRITAANQLTSKGMVRLRSNSRTKDYSRLYRELRHRAGNPIPQSLKDTFGSAPEEAQTNRYASKIARRPLQEKVWPTKPNYQNLWVVDKIIFKIGSIRETAEVSIHDQIILDLRTLIELVRFHRIYLGLDKLNSIVAKLEEPIQSMTDMNARRALAQVLTEILGLPNNFVKEYSSQFGEMLRIERALNDCIRRLRTEVDD